MIAWLLGVARAVNVTVCFEAEINFIDVGIGQEDYFQTNSPRPLRGVRFQYGVVGGALSPLLFADSSGCVVLNLLLNTTYTFNVHSGALVNDHYIDVRHSFTQQRWLATVTGNFPNALGTKTLLVNPGAPNRAWNVLTASSFALFRRDGGLTPAYNVAFYLTNGSGVLDSPSPCNGSSCVIGTDVYLKDDLANRKFAVAFAMGRTFLNHVGLVTADVDTSAANTYCGPTTTESALHSIEHDSAAATAGYAWFYAATVFNNTGEEDCELVNRLAADWDMLGGTCYDEVESPADHAMSCATGPSVVPARNQRAYCDLRHDGNDPAANTSVPIDWVRYLWDIQSNQLADFAVITSSFSDAINDPPWRTTRAGVQDAFQGNLFLFGDPASHGVTP